MNQIVLKFHHDYRRISGSIDQENSVETGSDISDPFNQSGRREGTNPEDSKSDGILSFENRHTQETDQLIY